MSDLDSMMLDRFADAAVYRERAEPVYMPGADRELSDARQAILDAVVDAVNDARVDDEALARAWAEAAFEGCLFDAELIACNPPKHGDTVWPQACREVAKAIRKRIEALNRQEAA